MRGDWSDTLFPPQTTWNPVHALWGGIKAMPHDLNLSTYNSHLSTIGPLQLAIHVVQNHHVGEQRSHWDKTNKGNYHFKLCMFFVLSQCDSCSPAWRVLYVCTDPSSPHEKREETSVIHHRYSCMEATWFFPECVENDLIGYRACHQNIAGNQKNITFKDNYMLVAIRVQGFWRKEKKLTSLLKVSLAILKSLSLQRRVKD